jgi:hypothetical protein
MKHLYLFNHSHCRYSESENECVNENLLLHLSAFTQPAVFADELCDYLSFPNLYEYEFRFHHAHQLFGIAYYFYFETSYYLLYFKCYLKYQYLIFFENEIYQTRLI